MKTAKNPKRKFFILILAVTFSSAVVFSIPKSVDAGFFTYDIPTNIKEFIIKPLVKKIANAMANKLANRVYEKISGQSDSHEPFFVLSWRNLVLESAARGNDIFRSQIAGVEYCDYFKDSLQQFFGADVGAEPILAGVVIDEDGFTTRIDSPGVDSFDYSNQCSIDFDIEALKEDFEQGGGWNAWEQLIQPQNNFFGALDNALDKQSQQIALEAETTRDQAVAGQGFLPNRKDNQNGAKGGPGGCIIGGPERCTVLGRTLAPEKLFGEAAAQTINTKIGSYYNATEFTDVVTILFDSIVRGVLGRLTDWTGQDIAGFIESEVEADRHDGEDQLQQAKDRGARFSQTCLDACTITDGNPDQCRDISLTPSEQQQCRANAIQICQARCQ